MSKEGSPLRLHELDIISFANFLNSKKITTTQGKIIKPLHDAHKEILIDPARYKVLAGGRRFSKSLLCALIACAVVAQPNRKVWIVGPTYNHAEKIFNEIWHILVNQLKLVKPGSKDQGRGRKQKGDLFLQTPFNSIVEGKSMDKPDSLAGDALDLVIIDEAALQPNLEDIWLQMLQPTLMDKKGSALFISSPRGRNDFYKLYLMGCLGKRQRTGESKIEKDESGITNDVRDWSAFRKTSYDNPYLCATPEESKQEIDNIYRRHIMSGKLVKFKQEYLADFDAVSDIVFPEFKMESSEDFPYHNVIDYNWHPNNGNIFVASDYNYSKPASSIFAQVNDYGEVVVFAETFTPNTTTYMQAQQISDKQLFLNELGRRIWKKEGYPIQYWKKIAFEEVIGDISGDQVQLHGRSAWDDFEEILGVRPVGLKQPRDVGCNMIRHFLQCPLFDSKGQPLMKENGEPKTAPRLFISEDCPELIYALSAAKFKKGNQGIIKEDYEEMPSGHEGLLDALRYMLVYLFHDRNQYFKLTGGF